MIDNVITLSSSMYNMLIEKAGKANVESGFYWDGIKCLIQEDSSLTGNKMNISGDMAPVVMRIILLTLNRGR